MGAWSKVGNPAEWVSYVRHRLGYAIRESGQALERTGCQMQGIYSYAEPLSRHTPVLPYVNQAPQVHSSNFVAPSALVSGDVKLSPGASLWYQAVVRSLTFPVSIGRNTNIQDNAFVGAVGYLGYVGNKDVGPTVVADNVSIGHSAVLQGCTVESNSLIGIGAVVQEHCKIGPFSILAAGAVLEPGAVVPSGEVWAGNPARKTRDLKPEEKQYLETLPAYYVELSKEHADIVSLMGAKIAAQSS